MLLSSLLFSILIKFQSPLGVAYNRFVHQCHGTVIQDSVVVILVSRRNGRWRYLHRTVLCSSPVGSDANIMTAWMTVTRTARSTWIVIGLTIRYSTINIFGGHVLTRTPRSPFTNFIPSQVVGPPGQQLDRVVGPLAKLSARWRSCRPRADGSTLIADTVSGPSYKKRFYPCRNRPRNTVII